MVCERLTDEQRDTVEKWHGYAMRSAMRWAAACGKLADCDDFKSAGNDALIRCVTTYDESRGRFSNHFGRLLQQEVGRVMRQLFGGGLVGVSGRRSGVVKSCRRVPMVRCSIDDIAEPCNTGDDFEVLEIEEAFERLPERHKSYLSASMDGVSGKRLGEINGRTTSNENRKIREAREAFAQLMGVA